MFFLVSASEELSQSRSQETNGQAKHEDGSGTALVFSLIQAIVIVSQHKINIKFYNKRNSNSKEDIDWSKVH